MSASCCNASFSGSVGPWPDEQGRLVRQGRPVSQGRGSTEGMIAPDFVVLADHSSESPSLIGGLIALGGFVALGLWLYSSFIGPRVEAAYRRTARGQAWGERKDQQRREYRLQMLEQWASKSAPHSAARDRARQQAVRRQREARQAKERRARERRAAEERHADALRHQLEDAEHQRWLEDVEAWQEDYRDRRRKRSRDGDSPDA